MTPVRRHRTHEEAHAARRLQPGDPRLPERLRQALHLGARLHAVVRPRGVFKFHSIEEANAFRERWSRG